MTDMKRRDVLRYSAAGAVTAATALAAGQVVAGSDPAEGKPKGDPRDFDELYRGRRIRGRHLRGLGRLDELTINDKNLALTVISTLFVPEDGSPPYVAEGYISAINHYDPVEIDRNNRDGDGLKRLSRKICDILGNFELSAESARPHVH